MNAVVHPHGRPAGVALGGFYIPDFYSRFLGGLRAMALEPIGDIADVSLSTGGATGPTSLDDFEDQDFSEYGSFNSPSQTIVTSPVNEGTYAGRIEASGGGESGVVSTDGSDTDLFYPDAGVGDTPFGSVVQSNGTGVNHFEMMWAVQGSASQNVNRYAFGWTDFDGGTLAIHKDNSGTLDSTAHDPSANTWYQLVVTTWDGSGNIECELRDNNGSTLHTLSATDSSYTDGGIGWALGASSGQYIYADAFA